MRIPAESVPPYLGESDLKTFAEGKRPEPIDGSAKLRGTLSNAMPKRQRDFGKDIAPDEEEPKNRRKSVGEDRRRDDRRKQDLPVFLDTRTTKSRRKPAQYSKINLKI